MCWCDFMKRLVIFTIFLNQIHCSDRFYSKFEELNNKDFARIIQLAGYQGDVVKIKLGYDDVKEFVNKEVDFPYISGFRKYYYSCDINEVVTKCFQKLHEKVLSMDFVLRCNVHFLLKNGTQEDIGDNYKGEIDDTNLTTFYFVTHELGIFESDFILFYSGGNAHNLRIFDENKGYRTYFMKSSEIEFECIPFSAVIKAEKIVKGHVPEDEIEEIKANNFKINNEVPPIVSQPSKDGNVPFEKKNPSTTNGNGKGNGPKTCCC